MNKYARLHCRHDNMLPVSMGIAECWEWRPIQVVLRFRVARQDRSSYRSAGH